MTEGRLELAHFVAALTLNKFSITKKFPYESGLNMIYYMPLPPQAGEIMPTMGAFLSRKGFPSEATYLTRLLTGRGVPLERIAAAVPVRDEASGGKTQRRIFA